MLGMCLFLASCATAIRPTWVHALNAEETEVVKQIVSSHLVDPYSAHWSAMTATRREADGSVTVCGMVDSKYASGAYSGMLPYRVLLKGGASRLISLSPISMLAAPTGMRGCSAYAGE